MGRGQITKDPVLTYRLDLIDKLFLVDNKLILWDTTRINHNRQHYPRRHKCAMWGSGGGNIQYSLLESLDAYQYVKNSEIFY